MLNSGKAPVLHCPTCYSTSFKTSKARPAERLQRFLGKLPVRCKDCNKRVLTGRAYVKWLRKQEDGEGERPASTVGGMPASNAVE